MSNTPIDNVLREAYAMGITDMVRAALAQAWQEGLDASFEAPSFMLSNPYTPVRYP